MPNLDSLMIGSWVIHKADWSYRNDEPVRHAFQWNRDDWYALGECTLLDNVIEFIPLTEKLLEDLGFTKVSVDIGGGINDVIDMYDDSMLKVFMDISGRLVVDGIHRNLFRPKYLHQFQRLYFVMTGIELPIKQENIPL